MEGKAARLLAKYYFRAFWRRSFVLLPGALFAVSLLLFLLILVPALRVKLRTSPFLSGVDPSSLTLSGKVYAAVRQRDGRTENRLVTGAQVESGGYRASTSSSGEYTLTILSPVNSEIPVIISYSGAQSITRVSFASGRKSLQQDFFLVLGPPTP